MTDSKAAVLAALNKVTKWRMVLAGWQLGTRSDQDPESNAVRDTRELLIILRVEMNALTQLMLKKGVFTETEFDDAVTVEAAHYDAGFEQRFPGYSTTATGVTITMPEALETVKRYRFKP